MQQISFNVPNPDITDRILQFLSKMDAVTDIHIKTIEQSAIDQIIPPKSEAQSVDDMLADWTDMEETTEDYRKRIWKQRSF
jgi:hypothetical protein